MNPEKLLARIEALEERVDFLEQEEVVEEVETITGVILEVLQRPVWAPLFVHPQQQINLADDIADTLEDWVGEDDGERVIGEEALLKLQGEVQQALLRFFSSNGNINTALEQIDEAFKAV